ncbi:MAG TPA: acetoin utilization AcuC family protein [Candidatus Limnocylindrales bacterium]|jgi:acetoin utilization protein AcuC|nr:acetoin utilization AcuC family protein [Candidatus Limnocylindrales bacterium]
MLLVFGPRSIEYDFGPGHPLTPRRFGPSIDLLRSLGAEPALTPEPASDDELRWCHSPEYLEVVRRFSADPYGFPEAGIGEGGDCPPFPGMHEASSAVAGGSIRAMEAILRGDVDHAFHPGGGLHHALRARASGFCIYNDPALAIARARRDGLRVFYIDLDVHHGDGVQALFWDDPGVLTFSIHETGRALFPGTGEAWEIGEGRAAGTAVNLPLWPGVGERAWLRILRDTLPVLAASFGPDLIVSQHGADSHAWDPLAHLNVTTTAHGEAARLVDEIAHRHAGGRWLATGGGGYDAYRVVPRTWALTWLAGAHRELPASTPGEWRDRWADEAARYGQAPLPETFDDAPNAGLEFGASQEAAEQRSLEVAALVRRVLVPRLLQVAEGRGWWDPGMPAAVEPGAPDHATGSPVILPDIDAEAWSRLTLAPRVIPPVAPADGHAIVQAALQAGARVAVAAAGPGAVGVAMILDGELLVIGVAPDHRHQGLGRALIEAVVPEVASAVVTVAERDPFDPMPASERAAMARSLLGSAGLEIESADAGLRSIDPAAIVGRRR